MSLTRCLTRDGKLTPTTPKPARAGFGVVDNFFWGEDRCAGGAGGELAERGDGGVGPASIPAREVGVSAASRGGRFTSVAFCQCGDGIETTEVVGA
jgi:hypothetical protein